MRVPGIVETAKLVHQNWRKNHRHHGGIGAVARCCLGMGKLLCLPGLPEDRGPGAVDCVTFSVVPNLTALWARLMSAAIPNGRARLWIGDCSGGFRRSHRFVPKVHSEPMINYLQGLKLDLFLDKFLRSEFFVVSDDDVFWLNQKPWQWAMEEFARDAKTAVVSLVPRTRFRWQLDGNEYQPMGSYCLVVRRETWLKEKLSFQAVPKPSPSQASYAGHYDTCDFANTTLIERGYRIAIAPPEVQENLVIFKGISSAILRIQKDPPAGFAAEYAKGPVQILETATVAKELKKIISVVARPGHVPDLADPGLIERAEQELAPLVATGQLGEIRSRAMAMTSRIAEVAAAAPSPETAAVA